MSELDSEPELRPAQLTPLANHPREKKAHTKPELVILLIIARPSRKKLHFSAIFEGGLAKSPRGNTGMIKKGSYISYFFLHSPQK